MQNSSIHRDRNEFNRRRLGGTLAPDIELDQRNLVCGGFKHPNNATEVASRRETPHLGTVSVLLSTFTPFVLPNSNRNFTERLCHRYY